MADGTALLNLGRHLAAGMGVDKTFHVGFGLELHRPIVTLPATIRDVGLVVAGHAGGHRWEVCLTRFLRGLDPDVTGRTGSEADVDLMIEVRERGNGRRFDRGATRNRRVARNAVLLLRQDRAM